MLLARREELLQKLAEEVGGEYEVCDVGDRDAVDRTAAAVLERHPKIGLLVNNAGIPARTGFVDGDPERIELVTRVNYLGGVWCLRAFLPGLLAAAPSDLVNIASAAGTVTAGTSGPYAASKHAQVSFPARSRPNCTRSACAFTSSCPGSSRRRASRSARSSRASCIR